MGYFTSDDNFIYLDAPYAEFYIPLYYFDESARFAEDTGSIIKSLGVFDVGFFEGETLKEMRVLNLPSRIEFFVSNSEERNVKLPNDEETTPCKVLMYSKGHKIMSNTMVQDSANCEEFLYFIMNGKVPSIVPYEESIKLWHKNQLMNKVNLGVPSVIEELILSTAYRNKDNPGEKFAHRIGKDLSTTQFDYIMNNTRQICQYTSTFTGMTFEDMDSMITTSLKRTKTGGIEAVSPIEDLIKL